ncbi:MAG: hypothetical protein MJY61_03025 [Bacteroidales bacterium]|nr:hypothetical protein [Bacteroidales bacterium]
MKKTLFAASAVLVVLCSCNRIPTTRFMGEMTGLETVEIKSEVSETDTVIALKDGKFDVRLSCSPETPALFIAGGDTLEFLPDGTVLIAGLDAEGRLSIKSKTPKKSANVAFGKYLAWDEKNPPLQEIGDTCQAYIRAFPESYVAYLAMLKAIGAEVFDDATLNDLYGIMTGAFNHDPVIQWSRQCLNDRLATAEGTPFVDMVIDQDPENRGKNVKRLSDFVGKGKYVLAHFWSSRDTASCKSVETIKEIYLKYGSEDFDVVSIAVYDIIPQTVKAAAELGITWNQIINAEHMGTSIYGFEKIPYLILFGPDGIILKRGLKLEELDAKISETLGR